MAPGDTIPEHNENEFMKRGYLLPEGCKDLADAMKLKQQPPYLKTLPFKAKASIVSESSLPPAKGIIIIHKHTTILQLATMLGQSPLEFAEALVKIGAIKGPLKKDQISSVETVPLDFKMISLIARLHGFVAQKAAE